MIVYLMDDPSAGARNWPISPNQSVVPILDGVIFDDPMTVA